MRQFATAARDTAQRCHHRENREDLVGVCLPSRADIATEDYVGIPNVKVLALDG